MEKVVVLVLIVAVVIVIAKFRADAAGQRKAVIARLDAEKEQRGGDYSPTAELFREVGVAHDPSAPLPHRFDVPPPPAAPPAPPTAAPTAAPAVLAASGAVLDLPAPTGAPVADLPRLPDVDLVDPRLAAVAPETAAVAPPTGARPATEAAASGLRLLLRGIAMPAGLVPHGALTPDLATFTTTAAATVVRDGLVAELDRLGCATDWMEPTVARVERNGVRGLVTIYPKPAASLDLDGTCLFPDVADGDVVVRMRVL